MIQGIYHIYSFMSLYTTYKNIKFNFNLVKRMFHLPHTPNQELLLEQSRHNPYGISWNHAGFSVANTRSLAKSDVIYPNFSLIHSEPRTEHDIVRVTIKHGQVVDFCVFAQLKRGRKLKNAPVRE